VQPSDLDAVCDQIAELQVRRKFFIGLVNKQTNAAKALVRRSLGWRWDDVEASRKAMNKRAGRIVDAALAGKGTSHDDVAVLAVFSKDLAKVAEALEPCEAARAEIEKEMVRAAKLLPAHPWQKSVQGFGEKALAIIVGEAGNLSRYGHEDKLKKRLGLAPYGGKAFSTWRREGGLSADEWTEAGYAPRRRAEIHSVIDPLFRGQSEWVNGKTGRSNPLGPYRIIYDKRRAHTDATHPEWKDIQRHMDGLRVMTQEFVTDLWSEWRKATTNEPDKAGRFLPSATEFA
jgi:hypothetical protein